jgi:hypothetical protein
MGERRGVYRVSVGKPEERNCLKDPGVGGRIRLKLIFETGSIWLRIGTGGGLL